jgi:hypothetical protein
MARKRRRVDADAPFTFTGADGPWSWIGYQEVDRQGAPWWAAARVAVRDGRVLIGELRVFPDTGDVAAAREGEWSHDVAAVPPHGLEAQTLKQLRLGSVPAFLLAFLSRGAQDPTEIWRKVARVFNSLILPGSETLVRPRPRRATGRDDRFYAALAAEYTDAIGAGEKHPVKALAARHGEPSAHIRDWLHEARVRGLLWREKNAKAGVPGGLLLPAALALLNRSPAVAPTKKPSRARRRHRTRIPTARV